MKTGASSLNPNAASYIPLSKRGAADNGNNNFSKSSHQLDYTFINNQQQNVPQTKIHNSEFTRIWNGVPLISQGVHNYNREFMDLAYLEMNFPGVSEDSLSDVYLANRCDLEASIDMLDQLEIYPDDPSNMLPDTLDIGDVPEVYETAPQKQRKMWYH